MKRVWILELDDLSKLRPKDAPFDAVEVVRITIPFPELNRFLHRTVGTKWRWGGREDWDENEWSDYAGDETLETWVLQVEGTPAGYYEIQKRKDGAIRIKTLGLRDSFIGKGLGGFLLTHAVRRSFERGAERVSLSTCSYDHPNALHNYKARGFQVIEEIERETEDE